jgi:hypothetical protein
MKLKYSLTWIFIAVLLVQIFLFFFLKREKVDMLLKRDKISFEQLLSSTKEMVYKNLEAYFSDHFPNKNKFIGLSNYLFKGILGYNNANQKVIWSPNNWLFYNATNNDDLGINEFYGYQELTAMELDKIKTNIQTIRNWCQRNDILFEVILCPNKHSIYPEKLPPYLKNYVPKSQLSQILKKDSSLINLYDVFLKKKKISPVDLYYATDTHWNQYGAFLAVKELSNNLAVKLPNLRVFDAKANLQINHKEMDLANMLGLNSVLRSSEAHLLYAGPPKQKIPHLVIVHDSFLHAMTPSLNKVFSRISPKHIFESGLLSPEILLKEKADVFVIELVERYKMSLCGDIHPDFYK